MTSLVFVITGAQSTPGGIAAHNRQALRVLADLARDRGLQLAVLSFLETDGDRPPSLPATVPFVGFAGNKRRLALALVSRVRERPLFVFDHVTLALPLLPFIKAGAVRPIFFSHGSEAWRRVRPSSRWLFAGAGLILANSQFTVNKMRERGVRGRAVACPLGLTVEFPLRSEPLAASGREIALENVKGETRKLGAQFFLLVGRMHPQEREKGHEELLAVWPGIVREFPDAQLVFAGPGNDRERLSEVARRLGVGDSVFIPGPVPTETLQSLYDGCYAFTMPSKQEGFGLVYLEAMNSAKACLGCRDDGGGDVIVDGSTGILVQNPKDAAELGAALRRLLGKPEETRAMGVRGFERLHAHFTSPHVQARLRRHLEDALDSPGSYSAPLLPTVANLRNRRMRPVIDEQHDFYAPARTPDEIRGWQLERWNELWATIAGRVPAYTDLVRTGAVPARFDSWAQFRATMPVTDRAAVQTRAQELTDPSRAPDFFRSTGGSTSQPVQFPVWESELTFPDRDMWHGRSWFGIEPGDRLFLLWGHSHLLGSGWRGRVNAVQRRLKDVFLGYHRYSAYDLGEEALRRAGEKLLAFRPAWMAGYAVALDRFALVNADRAAEFRKLGLKVVIATAEAFPKADSAERLGAIFGCPVTMEYGAVEGGPIAQQRKDGRFRIFWRHWQVEGVPSPQVPGAYEILLTSLYPRCFPLVRYRIGDLISDDPNADSFDQTFSRVIGRCNDCIALPDGTTVHSEAFTHAIKECADVLSFQVVQDAAGAVRFDYVSAREAAGGVEATIRQRLAIIHPGLGAVALRQVPVLPQTIAGKSRPIRIESATADAEP